MVCVERLFVVVSGLPGSGKTTLGRRLAAGLGLAMLDKDDILDALLDSLGAPGVDARQRLSRAADAVLQTVATASPGGVLSSFWRREQLSSTSGTPWAWLRQLSGARLIEVHCQCPPHVAADRFLARQRHPGHHDQRHSRDELLTQFEILAAQGPLGIGRLITVSTADHPQPGQVLTEIEQLLASHDAGGTESSATGHA